MENLFSWLLNLKSIVSSADLSTKLKKIQDSIFSNLKIIFDRSSKDLRGKPHRTRVHIDVLFCCITQILGHFHRNPIDMVIQYKKYCELCSFMYQIELNSRTKFFLI